MNRIAVVVALAFAGCLNPAWAENCPPGHTPSVAVVNAANSVTGSARVCADADGVNVSMDVMNLTAGHAYTVWFAYIDKASLCKVPDCSDVDWGAPNPLVVFGRMASTVAGKNDAQFSAELSGMLLSHGSQVELVILDHGMASIADLRSRARQLLTPQDPGLGAPGLGILADGALGQFWGQAIVNFP